MQQLTAQFATLRVTTADLAETMWPVNFLTFPIPFYAESPGFHANGETRLINALEGDTLHYDHDCRVFGITVPVITIEVFADRNHLQPVGSFEVPTAVLRKFRLQNEDNRLIGEDILRLIDTHFGGMSFGRAFQPSAHSLTLQVA